MSTKKLTLKDIADEAGVSLTTASMYLNGKAKRYNLSTTTCERIEQVMKARNFTPNLHARAIASKKTFLVGVLIAQELESSFWLNILSGLETALAARNYHLVLSVTRNDPKLEQQSLRFMRSKGVDGIIICPTLSNRMIKLDELAASMPVVTLNVPVEGIPGVWNDNFTGGRKAIDYLLESGHRRIAHIGSENSFRFQAYKQQMNNAGQKEKIFPSVDEFMKHVDEFTAVFCFCDYMLLALYQQAAAMGIRIPEQLSVIGYDQMDFLKLLTPAPATISQYKNELGAASGNLILKLIDEPDTAERQVIFEPQLVTGQSVATI